MVQIQAWEQYSWTRKAVKPKNDTNLFSTCHKDLRSLNKHVALQNLSIYYMLNNSRQKYKNNKLRIIVPRWNDEVEVRDGSYSVSDIQLYRYNEYIIKKKMKY